MGLGLLPFSFWKANDIVAGSTNPANPSFIFVETFDTPAATSYDKTWTVGSTGSGLDPDYTATVLEGTQSLRMTASGNTPRIFSSDFTPGSSSTLHAYLKLQFGTFTASTNAQLFSIRNSTGATILVGISVVSGNVIRLTHGSSTVDTVGTVTTGVTYHIWLRYTSGSGANGLADLAISTNGIRPTSGNYVASLTNGTATNSVGRIYCGTTAAATYDVFFDRVILADSAIYDNP